MFALTCIIYRQIFMEADTYLNILLDFRSEKL